MSEENYLEKNAKKKKFTRFFQTEEDPSRLDEKKKFTDLLQAEEDSSRLNERLLPSIIMDSAGDTWVKLALEIKQYHSHLVQSEKFQFHRNLVSSEEFPRQNDLNTYIERLNSLKPLLEEIVNDDRRTVARFKALTASTFIIAVIAAATLGKLGKFSDPDYYVPVGGLSFSLFLSSCIVLCCFRSKSNATAQEKAELTRLIDKLIEFKNDNYPLEVNVEVNDFKGTSESNYSPH